jgi:hypothetical protein
MVINSHDVRKFSLSKRKLKALKVCDPMEPSAYYDIIKMHTNWKNMVYNISQGCKSENQFQSRLNYIELIGSKVIVVDSTVAKQKGFIGILTAESLNCFYISRLRLLRHHSKWLMTSVESDGDEVKISDHGHKITIETVVKRFIKADVVLAIIMPSYRNYNIAPDFYDILPQSSDYQLDYKNHNAVFPIEITDTNKADMSAKITSLFQYVNAISSCHLCDTTKLTFSENDYSVPIEGSFASVSHIAFSAAYDHFI